MTNPDEHSSREDPAQVLVSVRGRLFARTR
jgi:hypothetical protein